MIGRFNQGLRIEIVEKPVEVVPVNEPLVVQGILVQAKVLGPLPPHSRGEPHDKALVAATSALESGAGLAELLAARATALLADKPVRERESSA